MEEHVFARFFAHQMTNGITQNTQRHSCYLSKTKGTFMGALSICDRYPFSTVFLNKGASTAIFTRTSID